MTSIGPSQAPIAAISLTSPAPMPPSAYNGSQSAVATVHPSRLLPAPATPPVDAETKIAAAAAPSVSALGIRRRERSNPHAANPMRIAIESCTFMAYRQSQAALRRLWDGDARDFVGDLRVQRPDVGSDRCQRHHVRP